MFLRICVGVGGTVVLALAVVWASGVVSVLDPDFNPRGQPEDQLIVAQAAVGGIGLLAALVAAGSALAFAKTAGRRWLMRVAVSCLCALPLFAIWGYLFVAASAS